ncbi:hypothetical protein [Runella aurantiaca]|uniref:Uncharacterized protein n=1 Tax=Runella aurantiaca TaxID=2282308 RepID=A0A369IEH2_9BACT|nr:hypothetical protein [Runella aurantiaca]RDB05634.1 hypothetical protein DVG78_11565 [Runella aurantiaca]
MNTTIKLLIAILLLLLAITVGQTQTKSELTQAKNKKFSQTQRDSIIVEYETLMKIARKYGVEKNFSWEPKDPKANPKNFKKPDKVVLRISLEQFEAGMKQLAFNEKRSEILNQFYFKDYPNLSTVKAYIALKREYIKKYPEYLKDEAAFQEARIQEEEKNADKIILNTKNFQKVNP